MTAEPRFEFCDTRIPSAAFEAPTPVGVGVIDLESSRVELLTTIESGADPGCAFLIKRGSEPVGFAFAAGRAVQEQQLIAKSARAAAGIDPPAESAIHISSRPSVSVVIPTGGRSVQLQRCLASLRELDNPASEVVVVVNNTADHRSVELVREFAEVDKRFRVVVEPRPGSSVARNRGVAECKSEIIAFTDDDVVVESDWLDQLVAPFADPTVEVVTGMVLPLELTTDAQKRFERFAGFSKGISRRQFKLGDHASAKLPMFPFWGAEFGSGNSMAFRRAGLIERAGFDPALGAGSRALAGADVAAFSSALLSGGMLVYEPRAICWHEHRRDTDALGKQMFNYGVGCGAIFTKFALANPARFLNALTRTSISVALKRSNARQSSAEGLQERPKDLNRAFWRGLVRGPVMYLKSIRWAHRLDLRAVINGR